MAASELSAPVQPIKLPLRTRTYLSGGANGSDRSAREASVGLVDAPWPWRVTRVRLSEAARLAGVSRSSLHRALEKRHLSCDTDEKGQGWIDVNAIARAYPDTFRSVPRNVRHTVEQLVETALERELRERLADKDAVIADLRRRLDAEAEERRQVLAILGAIERLLENNTQAAAGGAEPSPDPPAEAAYHAEGERRAPWWRRWWR